MKNMPISRKVYKDIKTRISETLSAYESSVNEAMRLFESYLIGESAESDDNIATVAFMMVKTEIDRAVERSRKARARAEKKRIEKETELRELVIARTKREASRAFGQEISRISEETHVKMRRNGGYYVSKVYPDREKFIEEWIRVKNDELYGLDLNEQLRHLDGLAEAAMRRFKTK